MKKVFFVFGTRPEAIKLAPVIRKFIDDGAFEVIVCSTGQHLELMQGILEIFKIKVDYNLESLNQGDTLNELYLKIAGKLSDLVAKVSPDLIIVHGDTISTLVGSTVGFLSKIPVAHVEAGLRTFDKKQPWPEEINRSVVGIMADYHFAPTERAAANLERTHTNNVFVVGNTVVDAVKYASDHLESNQGLTTSYSEKYSFINPEANLILVTLHRRENYGDGFVDVCSAIRTLAEQNSCEFIFPVHFNPNVRKVVFDTLGKFENIHLVEPLKYLEFIFLMSRAKIIITDSGGIQEEAPYFKVPILVCRNTTERPEVIESGAAKLVGTDKTQIIEQVERLLTDGDYYKSFQVKKLPFGDGDSSDQILKIIKQKHQEY